MATDANGCKIVKIDSNVTGVAIAEEKCLKELPDNPVWQDLEANSYSDFGGEISTVSREPIDPGRQNKKGTVVDVDASGGFNIDLTKTNMNRTLQGFFVADARETFSTAPLNAVQVPVTAVVGADKTIAFVGANGLKAGQLVLCEGFGFASNNGVKTVVSGAAGKLTVAEALMDESPAPFAKVTVVGGVLPIGAKITIVDGIVSLVSTGFGFDADTTLFPGKWVFIGGDFAHAFNTKDASGKIANLGFARINSKTADALVFDDVTFNAVAETAATTIHFYGGVVIRNEKDPKLIKRRSYNLERTLGEGEVDTQAEYLEGAVPNELTLNVPQGDKLNVDLTFVACANTHRSGAVGDKRKPGIHLPVTGEDAFNTALDVYRIKMAINRANTSNGAPLFGYVTEGTITVSNNVTPVKVVGVVGAADTSMGNFVVGGSVTALFTTVEAIKAIQANANVSMNMIFAAANSGFIFDIPLLSLGGGRLNVEKDNPITIPLDTNAAENKHGYTLLYQFFPYLPVLAMP